MPPNGSFDADHLDVGLALAVDALLEAEADELVLGRLAVEELLGLVVEVVELALDDRDDVARDVLVDLGVVQRPLLALALGAPCRRRGNRFHRRESTKSQSGFLPFIGRARLGADRAPVAVDGQRGEHGDQADASRAPLPTRRCPPGRPRHSARMASTIVRDRVGLRERLERGGHRLRRARTRTRRTSAGRSAMKPSAWARLGRARRSGAMKAKIQEKA